MFSVPLCLSRTGGWFSAARSPERKGARGCDAGSWGACIDVPLPKCDEEARCSPLSAGLHACGRASTRLSARAEADSGSWHRCCGMAEDKELFFRDGEVLLDDQGLRLLPHVDKGWHHVLFNARRASAQATGQVMRTLGRAPFGAVLCIWQVAGAPANFSCSLSVCVHADKTILAFHSMTVKTLCRWRPRTWKMRLFTGPLRSDIRRRSLQCPAGVMVPSLHCRPCFLIWIAGGHPHQGTELIPDRTSPGSGSRPSRPRWLRKPLRTSPIASWASCRSATVRSRS
jgi:hypothetical protein